MVTILKAIGNDYHLRNYLLRGVVSEVGAVIMDKVTGMAKQIVDYVRQYGGVSFVELERKIQGFKGDHALYLPSYPNLILWPWVSPEAVEALNQITDVIEIKPCHFLVYMTDGKVPDIVMAKRIKAYKSERWLPVTFSIRRQGLK